MNKARIDRGRILWYECMTTDPSRALDFYDRLFGWKVVNKTPSMMPNETYHHLGLNGQAFGGLLRLPDNARKMGAPSHWFMYVAVPDVDQSHAEVQKLGGRSFVAPTDIPNAGRFVLMGDPQGGMFAMMTPAPNMPEAPPETKPRVGQVSWHELATTDHEAAFTFYQKIFGWEKRVCHDMGPLGMYQIIGRPGVAHDMGAMFNRPPEMPVTAWCLYVSVPNADASAKRIGELGGQVINGPMDVPEGDRIAQAMDPTGALFAVHQAAN